MPSSAKSPAKPEQEIIFVLQKINAIMRNQFIIDLMILVQGVSFIVRPERAHKGIIESFAIVIFFAALSILLGFVVAHQFNKQNFHQIIFAFIFIIASVALYFTAGFFAPVFYYFLAGAIIVSGFSGIFSAYHLASLRRHAKTIKKPITNQTITSVSTALKRNVKLESERVLSPTIALSIKLAKFRFGQVFINFLLIVVGATMILFRFVANSLLIRLSGSVLVFSATSDLIALIWTRRESATAIKLTHYNAK